MCHAKYRAVPVVIIFSLLAASQQTESKSSGISEPRIVSIEAANSTSIPFRAGMPGVVTPIKCSSGKIFLRVAATDSSLSLISISPKDKSTIEFTLNPIPDISSLRFGSFFVNESDLYVMVTGVSDVKSRKSVINEKIVSGEVGVSHYYVARYGFDGQIRQLLKLDLPFRPVQIGVFHSGAMILAGIDNLGNSRVGMVKSDGTLDRYVDLPGDLSSDSKAVKDLSQNEFNGFTQGAIAWAVGLSDFVPFRGHLLLVRRQTSSAVYEISPSLEVRKVNLLLPAGFRLFTLVTGDDSWTGLLTTKIDGKQGLTVTYMVFDPETGLPLEKLIPAQPFGMGLGCANRDELTMIKREQDGSFVLTDTRRAP